MAGARLAGTFETVSIGFERFEHSSYPWFTVTIVLAYEKRHEGIKVNKDTTVL